MQINSMYKVKKQFAVAVDAKLLIVVVNVCNNFTNNLIP